MTEIHLPILGAEGEPCGSCGSPLATDQRYCLGCGWRRGSQRVDVERLIDETESSRLASASAVPVAAGGGDQKAWTPFAVVGSITVLGVMMLLGVLIGQDNGGTVAAAPASAPIVLGPDGSTASGGGSGQTAPTGSGSSDDEKSKGGDKKSEGVTEDPAVTDAVANLEDLTGPEYAKEAAKLPDTVAIPGEPPKPDGKDPGAGSDAITIE